PEPGVRPRRAGDVSRWVSPAEDVLHRKPARVVSVPLGSRHDVCLHRVEGGGELRISRCPSFGRARSRRIRAQSGGAQTEITVGTRTFGWTGGRMSYYARVFCTADAVPTIRTLLTWLRDEAGYAAEVPEKPKALDSPK